MKKLTTENLLYNLKRMARPKIIAAGRDLKREMRKALLTRGRGIHWPGLPNRSSAAGDPPALQTGQLRRSIRVRTTKNGVKIVVAKYGIYLEFGTRTIAPRPFIRPALQVVRRKYFRRFYSNQGSK